MAYKLPQLPEQIYIPSGLGYTKEDMRAYATAAIEAQGVPDGMALAVIGCKHFGNPIPRAWYAAAKELLASYPPAPQAIASAIEAAACADRDARIAELEKECDRLENYWNQCLAEGKNIAYLEQQVAAWRKNAELADQANRELESRLNQAYESGWNAAQQCHANHGMSGWSVYKKDYLSRAMKGLV